MDAGRQMEVEKIEDEDLKEMTNEPEREKRFLIDVSETKKKFFSC